MQNYDPFFHQINPPMGNIDEKAKMIIKDVWCDNLEEELAKIRELVDTYPYVSMDTEFPGVVARPLGNFNKSDYNYQTLRCNVDMLKLIQLGLTFADENGKSPSQCTWQFNFKFDIREEMYAQDSIDFLKRAGINFDMHYLKGIEVQDFGELLISSGLVMNEDVKWIAFHSGHDLGYLVKLVTCQPLPKRQSEFFEVLKVFFPSIYDVKYMMKSCRNLTGGLKSVAVGLQVDRIGPEHQAGSDSLLTMHTFFEMKKLYFEDHIDDDKYCGVLYGLGISWIPAQNQVNRAAILDKETLNGFGVNLLNSMDVDKDKRTNDTNGNGSS